MVLHGAPSQPQRVSINVGGTNFNMERPESLLTKRKHSLEFNRIETLEPSQLPHLLNVASFDREAAEQLKFKKESSFQRKTLEDKLEPAASPTIKNKSAVLSSNIAASQVDGSSQALDMLAKQATPRKSQILEQHAKASPPSRSRSPTTQKTPTPGQHPATVSPSRDSTAKRGLSQAGEDLDKILIDAKGADLESKKSRTNHKITV